MKKLYFLLFALLISSASFSQPIITAIIDGPCTGGEPKVIEIYAQGSVDFSNYVLVRRTNANAWDNSQNSDISALGMRTNEFVYLVGTDDTPEFSAEYPTIPGASIVENGYVSGNGDDSFRIVTSDLSTVIDEFGGAIDGSGETWEYLDSWAKRNNATGPDASFNESNWTFGGVDALDGQGTCNAGTSLSTLVPLGDFSLSTNEYNQKSFSVYPNPTNTGSVNVVSASSSNFGNINVAIFDVLGKQVINKTITSEKLNVSSLNTGVYVMKITQGKATSTKKLVIN